MAKFEEEVKQLNIKAALSTLVVSSFGFVAALFWRDAIRDFLDLIIPAWQGVVYSFVAAIIVTIMAIVTIYLLSKAESISVRDGLREMVVKKKKSQKGE